MQGSVELRDCMTPDLLQVIDGCCDIKVVTTGTLSAFGVHDSPFQQEVDRTNLAKFGPGGHRRDDGKWIKPPDWQPPRIQQILDLLYP
jgi:predicted HAD superfamily Cof-like phosphohydrolase